MFTNSSLLILFLLVMRPFVEDFLYLRRILGRNFLLIAQVSSLRLVMGLHVAPWGDACPGGASWAALVFHDS